MQVMYILGKFGWINKTKDFVDTHALHILINLDAICLILQATWTTVNL